MKSEVDQVKSIILYQQKQIEKMESERRAKFAIFSGIPENDVLVGSVSLKEDLAKVKYHCKEVADIDLDLDKSIESCT